MKIFHANDACFRCPCAKCRDHPDTLGIDKQLATKVNMIQSHIWSEGMRVDLVPTSGMRCPEHNAAVGGKPHSYHLAGLAVDFATGGDSALAYRIVDAAMVWNIPFIEVCAGHIHIDLRENKLPQLIVGPG